MNKMTKQVKQGLCDPQNYNLSRRYGSHKSFKAEQQYIQIYKVKSIRNTKP